MIDIALEKTEVTVVSALDTSIADDSASIPMMSRLLPLDLFKGT